MSTKTNTKNVTKNVSRTSTKNVSKNKKSSHNLKGKSKMTVSSAISSKEKDTDLSRGGREKEFSLLDNPSQHHLVSMRMMGVYGENRLKKLHELFDKYSLMIKTKKMAENN